MGLYLGGLIMGRMFASKIWVHIFGRAYLFIYLFFFLGGGLIIGILWYSIFCYFLNIACTQQTNETESVISLRWIVARDC